MPVVPNPETTPTPAAAPEPTPNAEATEPGTESDGALQGAGEENPAFELTAVPPELLDQYMNMEEAGKTGEDAETDAAAEKMKEPETEPAEEPEKEPAEEPTEEPETEPAEESAEQPAEEPEAEPAEEPEKETAAGEPEEIVENVDLDADIYESIIGSVALNESDGPLEFVATEDGVPVTAKPRLMQNGPNIRVSLDDLCKCAEGWRLTDDGVGTIVLEAAGYTLAIYNEENGCSATVDGIEVPMKEDDLDFSAEGHFINAEFLAGALKGEAAWEPEESTLMLRIRDKADGEISD